jgi:malonate decarboxylase beta subunit
MNGPEVIEQEAGIDEFDSTNRELIWGVQGGEQRYRTNLVDALVQDDVPEIKRAVATALEQSSPAENRSDQVTKHLRLLGAADISECSGAELIPLNFADYGIKNGR